MKELREIIDDRDVKFHEGTIKIFLAIDLCIECVEVFLGSVEPMFKVGIFTWNDVYMEADIVTILGVVGFEPDMVIETDEGTIDITEDNIDYFQHMVRMSLPYELVANASKEAIMDFLEELHNAGQGENFDGIIEKAPVAQAHAQDQEFDLTDLTTDQIAALKLYNNDNPQRNN